MTLSDRVRAWLTRQAEVLRSWPIINELWQRIRPQVTTPARRSETLDYYLAGASIAQSAAQRWPGSHGPVIVTEQRELENLARAYILDLEKRLSDLQREAAQATGHAGVRARQLDHRIAQLQNENARLRAALALARQAAQATPATAGGGTP